MTKRQRDEIEDVPEPGKLVRGWVFTLNNYVDEDWERMKTLECRYLVVGKEVGESGTPHLQGYVEFKDGKSLSAVRKCVSDRAHFSWRRGTPEQAEKYCKKDDDFLEKGEKLKTQKEKGEDEEERWKRIYEAAAEGRDEDIPYKVRFFNYKSIQAARAQHLRTERVLSSLNNFWIYGDSGIGKSDWVRRAFPGIYDKPSNANWWDLYDGEEAVMWDEFAPGCCTAPMLNRIADHYPFMAEVKGHYMKIRPKHVVIVSNYRPEDCYSGVALKAVQRRFNVVHMYVENDVLRTDKPISIKST